MDAVCAPPPDSSLTRGSEAAPGSAELPPGQRPARGWPVLHYGRVPKSRPGRWDLRVGGATRNGSRCFTTEEFAALPRVEVPGSLHCVTGFSLPEGTWGGVATSTLLELVPPAASASHVMVSAEYGYYTNLRLEDLAVDDAILATHRDGVPLTPEHGWPLRLVVPHLYGWKGPKWLRAIDYLVEDRRGFWEERGYHNRGEIWREQRYSHHEEPGDGPT